MTISDLEVECLLGVVGSDTSGIMQLGILDVGKAAKLLSDITATGEEEADLRNMQVIAEESLFLSVTRSQVRMQAQVWSAFIKPTIVTLRNRVPHQGNSILRFIRG